VSPARDRARVFVALELGAELGAHVAAEVERVLGRGEFRLPAGAGLHLTLVFVGDVERAQLAALARALGEVLVGLVAPELRLSGTGGFPSFARSRVLWVGVEERAAAGRLAACRTAVLAGLARAGLAPMGEGHEGFTPHVTVARPRGARSRVPGAFGALRFERDWSPAAVALVESVLGRPEDRRYQALERFPFSGAG